MKKRTSPIWKISKKEFINLIKKSNTISEILNYFGLNNGSNFKTVVQRAKVENISLSELRERSKQFRKNFIKSLCKKNTNPLNKVLVKNSTYARGHLKNRLLKENILKNKCAICGLEPQWNGQKLIMVLDHINGVNNDHRLENLRLLCPNCNSQQSTFAGRRFKKHMLSKSEINPEWRKIPHFKSRRVKRPNKEELLKLLWEMPTTKLAKKYKVTDKAIAKWAKTYNISKPPRGYWAKKSKSDKKIQ